jgi:hypothetical protein
MSKKTSSKKLSRAELASHLDAVSAKAGKIGEAVLIDALKGMSGPVKTPKAIKDDDWTGKRPKEFSPYLIPQVDGANGKTVWFLKATPRGTLGNPIKDPRESGIRLGDAKAAWEIEKVRPFTEAEVLSLLATARGERFAKNKLDMVKLVCGAYASKEKPEFFAMADFDTALEMVPEEAPQSLLRMIEWRGMPSAYAIGLDRGDQAGVYYWWDEVPTQRWSATWNRTDEPGDDTVSSPLEVAPALFGNCGEAKYKPKLSNGRDCFAYKGVNGYLVLTLNND